MATITFRSDPDIDLALRALMSDDIDRSAAIRDAILTAWRLRRDEAVREEASALARDEDDRAESRSVLADMETLRAW